MATRQFSITSAVDNGRQNSISAADMPHLATVHTNVLEDAAKAAATERSMTLWEGLKLYPKAVAWSVAISTCIIMEGFQLCLIGGLYALPAFRLRFGELQSNGEYGISSAWQSGLSNGALIGEIIGLMIVGSLSERIGYRKTMMGALVLITGFIFILFFAQSLPMLLVGEILCGIPWGAFQTLTTTYASEVCPVALRAYLTTYVNLCWVIGQFLSSAVLKGVSEETGSIGYRLPYGLQWIWPIPLIIIVALAPESPWWLVRAGRKDEAKKQLLRLTSRNQPNFDADETINMIVFTTELEKANTSGSSYLDCFKGVDLRRTEIVCMVWSIQSLCGGSIFIGFSTYFFLQAGLSTSDAFSMTLGVYGLGAMGTIGSWFLMSYFGRRSLYLWGQVAMAALLATVGFLSLAPQSNSGAQWATATMVILFTFVYDATVGPVCYSLVAELPSTRLRNKTVVLARNAYNIFGVIANILGPKQLNPDAWNWRGKAGFFWAAAGLLCALWTYFRLPEPKGRTYAELDMLFESKVPARKFKTTAVEGFAAHTTAHDYSSTEKEVQVTVEKV